MVIFSFIEYLELLNLSTVSRGLHEIQQTLSAAIAQTVLVVQFFFLRGKLKLSISWCTLSSWNLESAKSHSNHCYIGYQRKIN